MHQRWLNRRYMSLIGDWLFWSRHPQNFGDFTRILDELCRLLFHWMLTTIWTISHLTANAGSDATQVPIQCDRRRVSLLPGIPHMFTGDITKFDRFWGWSSHCLRLSVGTWGAWLDEKTRCCWGFVCSNQCLGVRRAAWSGVALQSSSILEHFLHDASIIEIVVTLSPKGGLVELSKLDLIEIYSSGIHADTILIGPYTPTKLHGDWAASKPHEVLKLWLASLKTVKISWDGCMEQRWCHIDEAASDLKSFQGCWWALFSIPSQGARTLRLRCAPQPMVRNLLKLSILPWWSLLKDG